MFGGLSLSPGGAELPAEVAHIGRDPFDPEFDLAAAVAPDAAQADRHQAGAARPDAGLRHRQHLRRRGALAGPDALRPADRARCPRAKAGEVLTAATAVMSQALGEGGTSFDALYVNVNGSSGYFDRSLAVYGQEGEPCPRCGTADPPRAVHEPLLVPLPALPARAARHASRSHRVRPARPAGSSGSWSVSSHFLFVRHRHNWMLLFRFGLVGGSGVLVNMLVAIICNKLGPDEDGIFLDLPLTDFNIRWYHVFSTIAFLVANLWNFQLNRLWTFRSAKHSGWAAGVLPVPGGRAARSGDRPGHPDPADAPGLDRSRCRRRSSTTPPASGPASTGRS